ncbi:MAG: alcohol dehydrogenase catalytic domain-containing protein [Erythrobacter sp.]|nr:alcohol dehydrogenase catalytic domain-containing protein [Erythrobacter sp.]
MLSAVYDGQWDLQLAERQRPVRSREDDVLLAVRATGICGTDIGILSGAYGAATPGVVLGHEFAAEVVEASPGSRFAKGDRVAVDPTYFCGACAACRSNRPNHCEFKTVSETGVSRDGAFCAYHVTEERFLYPIPDETSFSEAALSEPLSCAMTGTAKLDVRPDSDVVIVGAGTLGLLYAWCISLRGAIGTIAEHSPARRAVAATALPNGWRVVGTIEEATEKSGGMLDIGVDTTAVAIPDLLRRTRPGGALLQIGLRQSDTNIDVGYLADKSISLIGSVDSAYGSFQAAVAAITKRLIPVERLVTHRIPLDGLRDGFSLLGCDLERKRLGRPGDAIKVVVDAFS